MGSSWALFLSLSMASSMQFLYLMQAFLSAILPQMSRQRRQRHLMNHQKNSLKTSLMRSSCCPSATSRLGMWLGPVTCSILGRQKVLISWYSHLCLLQRARTWLAQLGLHSSRMIFFVMYPQMFLQQSDSFFFFSFLILRNSLKLDIGLGALSGAGGGMLMIRGRGFSASTGWLNNRPIMDSSERDRRTFRNSSISSSFMMGDSFTSMRLDFEFSVLLDVICINIINISISFRCHPHSPPYAFRPIPTHYNPPLYIILVFVFHSLEIMEVKKINGYRILISQVLGQGASGTVYRGIQDETKLECAIKVVDKRILSKDVYRQSAMESEIQIMAKLKSVNIVGFLDVLVSHNNYYIVQELCESDLDKYLAEHRKIQEPTAIKFLTEICNGFLALVKQGIVHRDLKPANILISKGVLKIGDFGFAKANAHKKILNVTTVGTPLYMSQEVLRAQHYTSKCDIWSLGFIFYQMLHGKTPWTAKSECELLQNLRTQPLAIDPSLGTDTRDFLQQCLKFHQEERISWDSVFKHPIFGGYFDAYTSQNMELEDKYKKVMSDLRFQVNCQNIDLETLWRQLGLEEGKGIKFSEFQQFLEAINTSMSEWEQRFFFQKLDPQGRGEVSLAHLSAQLEKYSISTTSRHRKGMPMGLRQVRTLGGWGEGLEQKVRACFQKMHKILSSKGVSLSKTFVIYDRDSSGELTVDELAKIMLKLDPSFREEEIQAVFQLIDEDGSHSIKFEELDSYYRRVNGLGEGGEGKENGGS